MRAAIASGTLDVDGGTLYYEVAGPDDGASIVFIHGGFGDRRMWDAQFTRFAADHRVVRYDHRGYGRSSFPAAPYSPIDDLCRLLDALAIPRAHLVGNSMGAALALDFALMSPERVITVTMVANGASGFPLTAEERARYQAEDDSLGAVFAAARTHGIAHGVELWSSHPMVQVAHADPRVGPMVRRMIEESPRIFELEFWPSEPLEPPAAARLHEVRVPVLIVFGDRDFEAIQASARFAAAGIPGARLEVLRGTDHLPQMEMIDAFDALLGAFVGAGPAWPSE